MAGGCEELSSNKSKSSMCPESGKNKSSASGCAERIKDKKDRNKSKSKSACSEKGTGTGKDAFGRKVCPKVIEDDKKEVECHESRKKFFEEDDKKDKKGCGNKQEDPKEKTKCEDTSKKAKENYKCIDTSQAEKGTKCCSSADEKDSKCQPHKHDQNACGKIVGSSKTSGFCKDFGEQYVSLGPKQKISSSDDSDDGLKMPEPQVMTMRPCLPRVEKSISAKRRKVQSCIPTEVGCAQLKKPKLAEFFCIDARNQKMNECIKQYMNTDPSQIKLHCSQFIRKRMHTATQPPPSCGYPLAQTSPPSRAGFLPPKYRQMMGRWLPTAGVYVFVTAALTAWVTEWGPVVKHIPYYKDAEVDVSQSSPPSDTSEQSVPSETEPPTTKSDLPPTTSES